MSLSQSLLKGSLTFSRMMLGHDFIPKGFGRGFLDFSSAYLPDPPDMVSEKVNAGPVDCLWISDKKTERQGIILYFHGGGYHIGSPVTHRRLVYNISRVAKARALSVDYRMAPEHPFPAPVEDAMSAYMWLLEKNYRPSEIVVMGDSAGGGLAMALLLALKEKKMQLPAAAVLMSPWVDLKATGDTLFSKAKEDPWLSASALRSWASSYLQDHSPENQLASPLYGDLSGLPPVLIHVGTSEILLDDSRRFHQKLKEHNVEVELKTWPEMIHVFQAFDRFFSDARQSIAEMGKFANRHFSRQLESSPQAASDR